VDSEKRGSFSIGRRSFKVAKKKGSKGKGNNPSSSEGFRGVKIPRAKREEGASSSGGKTQRARLLATRENGN